MFLFIINQGLPLFNQKLAGVAVFKFLDYFFIYQHAVDSFLIIIAYRNKLQALFYTYFITFFQVSQQSFYVRSGVVHAHKEANGTVVHHVDLDSMAMKQVEYMRSEEHTSELQSRENLVCRLLLEKKKQKKNNNHDKRTDRQIQERSRKPP